MRLAHRVAELENLPHGLSEKKRVLKVRALKKDPSCVSAGACHLSLIRTWRDDGYMTVLVIHGASAREKRLARGRKRLWGARET